MITKDISTLKIHKLTQAQYERELAAGRIDDTALYLTPDESDEMQAKLDEMQSSIDALEVLAAANKAAHEANAIAIASKANQSALEEEINRAIAKEDVLQAAIDAFEKISVTEINNLF